MVSLIMAAGITCSAESVISLIGVGLLINLDPAWVICAKCSTSVGKQLLDDPSHKVLNSPLLPVFNKKNFKKQEEI